MTEDRRRGPVLNREVVGMAVERFRRHPVQTYLTLAGFVVGTASIILVVSLGLTGRGYVMAQIEGVGRASCGPTTAGR